MVAAQALSVAMATKIFNAQFGLTDALIAIYRRRFAAAGIAITRLADEVSMEPTGNLFFAKYAPRRRERWLIEATIDGESIRFEAGAEKQAIMAAAQLLSLLPSPGRGARSVAD
jgi:hypothetical protein